MDHEQKQEAKEPKMKSQTTRGDWKVGDVIEFTEDDGTVIIGDVLAVAHRLGHALISWHDDHRDSHVKIDGPNVRRVRRS